MKFFLLPALLALVLCACEQKPTEEEIVSKKLAEEEKAKPTPAPTPKPGEWMWKNKTNPLDEKGRRR